jgi:hypothetical protein
MANKRYDQFPAGTYDTNKIFLQADPATGVLQKVNLPMPGGGGANKYSRQFIFSGDFFLDNGTWSGVLSRNLFTGSIPANTLTQDGDTLRFLILGYNTTNAGTSAVEVKINNQNYSYSNIPAAGGYLIDLNLSYATNNGSYISCIHSVNNSIHTEAGNLFSTQVWNAASSLVINLKRSSTNIVRINQCVYDTILI